MSFRGCSVRFSSVGRLAVALPLNSIETNVMLANGRTTMVVFADTICYVETAVSLVLLDRLPARYTFAVLGFLGMANVYAMRVNLSVAMVVMVNSSSIPHTNASSECYQTSKSNVTAVRNNDNDGEFDWDEKMQGIILGSFFWGYIVTQLPGGRLAERFSGKWLFGFGVLCTAIFTILTPVAARLGAGYLIAVRILEGLGEGVTFPAMHVMLSKWSPSFERSKMSTFVYTGCQVGTVIAMPISGYLCDYGIDGGWPSVFYFFGAIGTVWFAAWAALAHDNPLRHPRITSEEQDYILQGVGSINVSPSHFKKQHMLIEWNSEQIRNLFLWHLQSPRVPWRQVLTSLPVWAIVVSHFGQNWGFYTLLTEMPTYMKNILGLNIKQNSVLSALPYLGMWLFGLLASHVADCLRSGGVFTTATVRKICNAVGSLGPAFGLMAVTVAGCDRFWILTFLTISVTLNGATYSGFQCNHIDIAPRFAGTLIGLTNSFATIPGFAAPYVVGVLTQNQQTLEQWSIVFYIASAIYVCVAVFFALFAEGEEQPWCSLPIEDEDEVQLRDASSNSDND